MNDSQRAYRLASAMLKIMREIEGCGPECSKDFLRLALNSVYAIAATAATDYLRSDNTDTAKTVTEEQR